MTAGAAPPIEQRVQQTTDQQKPQRERGTRGHQIYQKVTGALLFLAGAVILMGIITAEALYPAAYSTASNTVSDLGATLTSEGGVVLQPSATIFDATMVVGGILMIEAAHGVHRAFRRRVVTFPTALMGIGVLGLALLIQAKERSTTHRRGSITNPFGSISFSQSTLTPSCNHCAEPVP